MFKPFMHGLASQGGMGIGLYTARQMAEVHHGTLVYERLTEGSLFTFTLPARETVYNRDEMKRPTAIAKTEQDHEANMPIQELLPKAMNDYRVSIIEDDLDMMQQIRAEVGIYFETEGYTDGLSAIEHITANPPALVLCDVMLPDIDGYEVVSRLRRHESTRFTPVIMLTALDDEQHQIKAYEAGADDYMVKPCNYRLLIARAANLIKWTMRAPDSCLPTPDSLLPSPDSLLHVITSQTDKRLRDRIEQLVAIHLGDPNYTLDEMASTLKMGRTKFYADLSYFNRCFKARYGVAPSKYRKM